MERQVYEDSVDIIGQVAYFLGGLGTQTIIHLYFNFTVSWLRKEAMILLRTEKIGEREISYLTCWAAPFF